MPLNIKRSLLALSTLALSACSGAGELVEPRTSALNLVETSLYQASRVLGQNELKASDDFLYLRDTTPEGEMVSVIANDNRKTKGYYGGCNFTLVTGNLSTRLIDRDCDDSLDTAIICYTDQEDQRKAAIIGKYPQDPSEIVGAITSEKKEVDVLPPGRVNSLWNLCSGLYDRLQGLFKS